MFQISYMNRYQILMYAYMEFNGISYNYEQNLLMYFTSFTQLLIFSGLKNNFEWFRSK